jgi:hypothetical protein
VMLVALQVAATLAAALFAGAPYGVLLSRA